MDAQPISLGSVFVDLNLNFLLAYADIHIGYTIDTLKWFYDMPFNYSIVVSIGIVTDDHSAHRGAGPSSTFADPVRISSFRESE